MSKNYYEGKDFVLRGTEKEDYTECLYAWANDDNVTHFMYTGINPSSKILMEEEYDKQIKGNNVLFTIMDKKTQKPIGLAGLYEIRWQARFAEFRIIIGDKTKWGKGIGTDVARILLKHAFENLNLNKVWLGVSVDNKGAAKSYEKAGFVKEGTLRQEIYRNGKYYDASRYSFLRSEFHGKDA